MNDEKSITKETIFFLRPSSDAELFFRWFAADFNIYNIDCISRL